VVVSVLALVAVAVAAVLPARLVADKEVADADGTERDVATPYALVPAAAQPVADRVSYGDLAAAGVSGVEVDTDPDGQVYFVTVSEPKQSLLGLFVSGLPDPASGTARDAAEVQWLTYEDKYGSSTPSQQRTLNLQMMRTSSQVAQYVALSRAGFTDAEVVPGPVQVEQRLCAEVANNRCARYVAGVENLQDGDTFVEVDGTPIHTASDLTTVLAGHQPGDTVSVVVDRIEGNGTERVSTDVTLIADPSDPDRAIIGFYPFDTRSISLPFEIDIDTGRIGGPSAGLAFTLTLIDELTPGDLLGGTDVAVTGTIGLDGDVGAIGALEQKASAVRQAGLHHFIVPASQSDAELAEARSIAGDGVELIPVATVDEALAALERLGGDPVRPVSR
jgi:Lon-like protease